jgi:hypothetical protein
MERLEGTILGVDLPVSRSCSETTLYVRPDTVVPYYVSEGVEYVVLRPMVNIWRVGNDFGINVPMKTSNAAKRLVWLKHDTDDYYTVDDQLELPGVHEDSSRVIENRVASLGYKPVCSYIDLEKEQPLRAKLLGEVERRLYHEPFLATTLAMRRAYPFHIPRELEREIAQRLGQHLVVVYSMSRTTASTRSLYRPSLFSTRAVVVNLCIRDSWIDSSRLRSSTTNSS